MAYPASLLINRAYNLSGIVARDFEETSGSQGSDGLFLLNELLDFQSTDMKLIPYYKRTVLNLVQGQEMYLIPNLYQIETFTFNIGEVRFPTSYMPRIHYFGDGRVDNITALPFSWHLERTTGGSNFYVYFLPQQNYVANITGKYALTDVDLFTDLNTLYDNFYISYLRYGLAEYICMENDIDFDPRKERQLRKMEKKLAWISPPDFTMKKISFLNNNQPFNWAHTNISPGYFP